jgi:hypothetical protein
MDRRVDVLVGDPLPEGLPPPNRGPLVGGLMVALVAFGVWGLVANQPAPSPETVVSTTLPEAFPTTTVYHSPLDDGGGEILFPGSGTFEFVADGPAGLLAAGYSPFSGTDSFVWKAEDGRTWEYVGDSTETFKNVRLTGLVGGPDGYVASGILTEGGDISDARPMVWTSVDGLSWLPADGLPAMGGIHRLVGVGDDLLVALGWEERIYDPFGRSSLDIPNPRMWISVDGRFWQQADIPIDQGGWFGDVVWDGDVLVLGGSTAGEGRLWTSSDRGLTWELVEDPGVKWPIGLRFISLTSAADGTIFALIGNDFGDSVLWRRNEAGPWTREGGITTNHADWITWTQSTGLIIGRGLGYDRSFESPLTSDDGEAWAAAGPTWQASGQAVEVNGTIFIPGVNGDQPRLWQWPGQPVEVIPPVGPWVERFVFAAEPFNWQVVPWSEIGPILKVDEDWRQPSEAGRWEPMVFEGARPQWVYDVVATSRGWLMWGWDEVGSFIWSSFDGAHWAQTLDLDPGGYLSAVYELNGLIVVNGQDSGDWFQATSVDGLEWAFEVADGPGLSKVLKTDAGYVALTYFDGPAVISLSSDGVSWQVIESLPPLQDVFATPFGLIGLSAEDDLYNLSPDLSSATPVEIPFEELWLAGVTGKGLAMWTGGQSSIQYTEDLETWIELPLTLGGGFPGTSPQFIGGDGLLVAGWDRGAVKIWEYTG